MKSVLKYSWGVRRRPQTRSWETAETRPPKRRCSAASGPNLAPCQWSAAAKLVVRRMGGARPFGRSGPVSEAPPMNIRTPQPLPEGPAEGGAFWEGLRGSYAHKRGIRDRIGPSKRPRPPIRRTTHLAAADHAKGSGTTNVAERARAQLRRPAPNSNSKAHTRS